MKRIVAISFGVIGLMALGACTTSYNTEYSSIQPLTAGDRACAYECDMIQLECMDEALLAQQRCQVAFGADANECLSPETKAHAYASNCELDDCVDVLIASCERGYRYCYQSCTDFLPAETSVSR